MLVDRSLRLTFRTFSTLFLCVAALTIPLHLAYSAAFSEVITVADLHGDIEDFPGLRQVRGVGRADLDGARRVGWGIAAAELLAVPLLVRATRRVLQRDADGDVPEATDAWLYALGLRPPTNGPPQPSVPATGGRAWIVPVLGGVLVALAVGLLVHQLGSLVADPVPNDRAWVAAGVIEGAARAIGAPFFLVAVVVSRSLPKASGRSAEG